MERTIDFAKFSDGLVPAIIQDAETSKVLMLGYMNRDAFEKTMSSGKVTFLVGQSKGYGQKVRRVAIFYITRNMLLIATVMPFFSK